MDDGEHDRQLIGQEKQVIFSYMVDIGHIVVQLPLNNLKFSLQTWQ
jgi:hypothetical protein